MDTKTIHAQWDAITLDHLREVGGAKWSRFPERIGAFIAEMDFGIHPAISQVIVDFASSERHGYATPPWPQAMAQAFSRFSAHKYGWAVDPRLVVQIPDVLNGLEAAIETFTNPGEPVIVPTPGYMNFYPTIGAINRPIIEVPSKPEAGWAMDLDGIDAAFSQGATSMVLCNPHNPTGRVFSRDELLALAEIVQHHKAFVFNDEIHAPLTLFGHKHVPYADLNDHTRAHTVTATSPSKAWNLPGHRCAQLIFNSEEQLAIFKKGRMFRYTDRVPTLGLFTNTAAYEIADDWLSTLIPYLEQNVTTFTQAIRSGVFAGVEEGRDYTQLEGTYLSWINMANTKAAQDPAGFIAKEAGIQVTPGLACGKGWGSYVRINLATPKPILEDIISRIGTALA